MWLLVVIFFAFHRHCIVINVQMGDDDDTFIISMIFLFLTLFGLIFIILQLAGTVFCPAEDKIFDWLLICVTDVLAIISDN